jgi:tetratricopeptide (TPR) repeat protein
LRTTRLLLPVLLALAPPLALIARAPEARSAPCQGSIDEARRHMEAGFSHYDKKRFVEAGAEFDAAYKAQPFSAFLANAAMAYQAALDFPAAIARYEAFLGAEPNPPDLPRIKQNLGWLKAQLAAQQAAGGDAGAPPAPEPPPSLGQVARSQMIVASDPPDAPLSIYARRAGAAAFAAGGANPGWEKVSRVARTPYDVSLPPGEYHVVIDAFKDYKRVETDLALVSGQLYELKAVLSQGEFMGFLRVLSTAPNARVYLDDPPPHRRPPWGRAPYGALVESGAHQIWVEAPGFEPAAEKVTIEHGKTAEIAPRLERVAYGYLKLDGNADEVSVKIDGAKRGVYTPLGEPLRIRLDGGKHRLSIEAPGRKAYVGEIEVPRGQELGVHGRLSFKPARSTSVITGALAVGAVVGGVALLKQAAAPQAVTPDSPPGNAPSGAPTWLRVGSGISFGVGAILGASTIYSIVVDPTPPSTVRLDKPKDLDDAELDVQTGGFIPGPRGRILGNDARAGRCPVL